MFKVAGYVFVSNHCLISKIIFKMITCADAISDVVTFLFKINAALSNRSLDNKATTSDVPVADIFVSAETQMFNYTLKKGYDNTQCFLYRKIFY